MLPSTVGRVPQNTAAEVERTDSSSDRGIDRLDDSEGTGHRRAPARGARPGWDIERLLEANASTIMLVGLVLGTTANRKFLLVPAAVAAFLLVHALRGWCPPLPILRRLGVRTQAEIESERYA